jgi:hypothetical protein
MGITPLGSGGLTARRNLNPLPFGDVAGDLGGAYNPAAYVSDWGNGNQYVDCPPVLGDTASLKVVDSATVSHCSQNFVLLIA